MYFLRICYWFDGPAISNYTMRPIVGYVGDLIFIPNFFDHFCILHPDITLQTEFQLNRISLNFEGWDLVREISI